MSGTTVRSTRSGLPPTIQAVADSAPSPNGTVSRPPVEGTGATTKSSGNISAHATAYAASSDSVSCRAVPAKESRVRK